MLSTNLQLEKTDVWTLSNYQSVLLDMMAACAYMNSDTLFLAKPLPPTENDFKRK
jgi:hypothetical protein